MRTTLLILATCLGIAADSSAPCVGKTQIDGYATHLDARLAQMKVRHFVPTESEQGEGWHEIRDLSEPQSEVASAYIDRGLPLAVAITSQTESGDWILYATYYFRSDGSLAKRHEHLNTFYGDATVIRDSYFGCHGEARGATTQHLDLKTKKPKKPEPTFEDERAPLFKHTKNLPFFSALKK